ncbi:MAG: OsmC family protein [Thaumarchaeota archaeon]|nr:OsmC family protein [Nitrososphaerota archaeon]
MANYAERSSVWGIKVESLEMSVEGHFVAMSGYGFDEIRFETKIVSRESPEKIKKLALATEGDCYVTNTLKRACPVSGRVFLNGEPLIETGKRS